MKNGKGKGEARWRGTAVSDGAAAGRVLRIHSGGRTSIYRVKLEEAEVGREVRRYEAAVRLARRQLLALKKRAARTLGDEHAYIFDAHLLMLEDRKLNEDVEAVIRAESVNSEWAVKVVTDRILAVYEEIKDDYLRERSSDIEDVTRRLLVALSGESMLGRRLTEDAVVVAEELMPSTLAELDFTHIKAFATDVGGWTSHTAIIARGLGIPAVVGLRDFYRAARTGDQIVIDAGRVVELDLAQHVDPIDAGTLVDATTIGLGRDPAALRRISEATGVRIPDNYPIVGKDAFRIGRLVADYCLIWMKSSSGQNKNVRDLRLGRFDEYIAGRSPGCNRKGER